MSKKLWGGRFQKRIDPAFERFSESIQTDWRLLPYDLRVARAHVRALNGAKVLTGSEAKRLISALDSIDRDASRGQFQLSGEDIHSAVQSALQKRVGPLAEKLHTGRSRNELVSQSTRLYCKEKLDRILADITLLQKQMVARADGLADVCVPGMTHLQNAQVVSFGHILLSYVEMMDRAKAALQAARAQLDVLVLGSGALAGTTFRLNQARMARDLGLSRITHNSYDVSGDRDFVFTVLSALTLLSLQLSRIAEDFLIGQMRGGLIDVDQSLCTGSSMMPQKKNADFLELSRGHASRFAANLSGALTLLKGLPSSYNRDLQWDKTFLFDSVEAMLQVLPIWQTLFRTLNIHRDRARKACEDEGLYATDLADWLVRKGMPFQEAHETVGKIVSFAEQNQVPISRIGLDLLRRFSPKIDGAVYDLFDPEASVRLKQTQGSTHPARVRSEISRWKKELAK